MIAVIGLAVCYIVSLERPAEIQETLKTEGKIKDLGVNIRKKVNDQTEKSATEVQAEHVSKPYWDTNKWEEINGFLVPKGARLVNNYLTNKVQRIFKYSTDDVILAYLAPQPGGELPPMQPIMGRSDETFLKSLKDPIIFNDDDSEKVRSWKELVTIARAQIKERIDSGEKFEDILKDNYRLMEENRKIRLDAQTELNQIYRSGDIAGAQKYKRVMDISLQQMGINALKDPSQNHKQIQERRQ